MITTPTLSGEPGEAQPSRYDRPGPEAASVSKVRLGSPNPALMSLPNGFCLTHMAGRTEGCAVRRSTARGAARRRVVRARHCPPFPRPLTARRPQLAVTRQPARLVAIVESPQRMADLAALPMMPIMKVRT